MFRKIQLLFAVIVFASVAMAADMFESRWKAPDAQPVDFSGKKIGVLIEGRNRLATVAAEEALAADITARGAQGIAVHNFASDSDLSSKETARALFLKEGLAGIVFIQGETQGNVPLDPNVWKDKSFWGTYGIKSSSQDAPATSQKDVKLYMQTKIYSLDQDKLIWVGRSLTKVSEIDDFIKKLVGSVAEEMKKQGLLKQK